MLFDWMMNLVLLLLFLLFVNLISKKNNQQLKKIEFFFFLKKQFDLLPFILSKTENKEKNINTKDMLFDE
jgi:hypothetical protein